MAVSGKTAAPHELPYFLGDDSPPDMGDVTQAMAERMHERLESVGLSQLVVPGGEADDAKIAVVENGVVTLKAVSGDATISEAGNLQLGSKVVGTSELADKSVTTGKMDDDSVTAAKIAENAVGSSEIAPDAVGSSEIATGAVGESEVAAAIKDAATTTPSLRTLGTGAKQAAAGNDSRLFATPKGAVAGSAPGTVNRYLEVTIGEGTYRIPLVVVSD